MVSPVLLPLESAVLRVFHQIYGDRGFPPPERILVKQRTKSGTGRYVDLETDEVTELEDGFLDMGDHSIEMKGLSNGLMAVVVISENRVTRLELEAYGGDSWDGEERDWSIV